MSVSKRDREAMLRQGVELARLELPLSVEPTGEQRRRVITGANGRRSTLGLSELRNDEDTAPEIGLHRRAAARGMLR